MCGRVDIRRQNLQQLNPTRICLLRLPAGNLAGHWSSNHVPYHVKLFRVTRDLRANSLETLVVGVLRISFGDHTLSYCGKTHRFAQVFRFASFQPTAEGFELFTPTVFAYTLGYNMVSLLD